MIPSDSDVIGSDAAPPPVATDPPCNAVSVLKQRRDFQIASRGKRVAMPGFVLQMSRRSDAETSGIRIGYTCSKTVGDAVARNRAKRRLRETARAVLSSQGLDGYDYVLVGRREATAALPFAQLIGDMHKALSILHGSRR